MYKISIVGFSIVMLFSACQPHSSEKKEAVLESSWHLPKDDSSQSIQNNALHLWQVYDDHTLQNRELTYRDERLLAMRETNSVYSMPVYHSIGEWEKRKKYLREHILVCAGLWPMPDKNPMNPKYAHRIDHGDYIVETVTIETYPGFFLSGNMYLPKGKGPFPAILAAHGHFKYGRLTNDSVDSEPGRSINFAKQGYVVFAYDMVGYNDTRQVTHFFANDPISALYGINLLGLQLRNSIRAMDYLLSRPEVDSSHVGITGASGGATQDFLLTAVDDRFQAAVPVNMISDNMQGGDLCENAPGLRVTANNMEFGAMIAPKPLLMISDSYDWTYNTRNTIYPNVKSIYSLYGVDDHIQNKHFDFIHNYNSASSEAAYAWFGKWLQNKTDADKLKQQDFLADSDQNMLAFMHRRDSNISKSFAQLPPNLYHDIPNHWGEKELDSALKNLFVSQIEKNWPKDSSGLHDFNTVYGIAMKHLLGVTEPDATDCRIVKRIREKNFIATQLLISARDKNNWIPCLLYQPIGKANTTVILTGDQGKKQWVDSSGAAPGEIVSQLLTQNCSVLTPDLFKQGEHVLQPSTKTARNENFKYFTTFNLTDRQEQIQDLVTIIHCLRENDELPSLINIYSSGNSAYTGLLLSAISEDLNKVVLDGNTFDPSTDRNMLSINIPGLMRVGGLKTVLALASKQNLIFSNADKSLMSAEIKSVAVLNGNSKHFLIMTDPIPKDRIIEYLKSSN